MSDVLALFHDDEPQKSMSEVPSEPPVTDWQVDLLRKALDARQLTTQAERRAAIEAAAERRVDSLRSLTQHDALRILSRLGKAPAAQRTAGSAWAQREEDTWIDKL